MQKLFLTFNAIRILILITVLLCSYSSDSLEEIVGLDVSYHGGYLQSTADGNTTPVESNNYDDEERLFYERKHQLEQTRKQQRNKVRRRILMMDLSLSKGSRGSKDDLSLSKGSRGSKDDLSLSKGSRGSKDDASVSKQERTDSTNDSLNGDLGFQSEPEVNERLSDMTNNNDRMTNNDGSGKMTAQEKAEYEEILREEAAVNEAYENELWSDKGY
jgi:hypothetical protein